jgi:hypothetical protein
MLDSLARALTVRVRVVMMMKTDYDHYFLLCQRVRRYRANKLHEQLEKETGGVPLRVSDVPIEERGEETHYWIVSDVLDTLPGSVQIDPDDQRSLHVSRSVSLRNLEHLLEQLKQR